MSRVPFSDPSPFPIQDRTLIHAEFDGSPFPVERESWRFVGERCFHDEHWDHGDRRAIF